MSMLPNGQVPHKTPRSRYRRIEPDSKPDVAGRSLLVFLDGTGNTFGPRLSNVPKVAALADQDPTRQLVYYQTGIGISYGPFSIIDTIAQIVDEGVAYSLPTHIQHAYTWLMNTWKPGDRIMLFGFSRGAFTARALAGMLQQVGLLPSGNEESVKMAYSIYASKADAVLVEGKETLAQGFKRTFSRDVYVHFVGVWDTVSSVGALIPRTLPFASGTRYIRHFRQALALDERRARFAEQVYIPDDSAVAFPTVPSFFALPPETCSIKEVWFSGAHSNVGGGEFAYDGEVSPSLSHLSLRWMVREAVGAGMEIDLHALKTNPLFSPFFETGQAISERFKAHKVDPAPEDHEIFDFLRLAQTYNPAADLEICATVFLAAKPGPRATADALSYRGDHLSLSIQEPDKRKAGVGKRLAWWWSRVKQRSLGVVWWIQEVSPTLKILWDQEGNTRRWTFASNFGRGRILPPHPNLHFSVKTRMDAVGSDSFARFGNNENVVEPASGYRPAARFNPGRGFDEVHFVE